MSNMFTDTQKAIRSAGIKEFLEKGFKDASLREIAAAAGVTTGAIYGYYRDKSMLFADLVEPMAGEFSARFKEAQTAFGDFEPQQQIETMLSYSSGELRGMLDYVYQNFEVFRLIFCCSAGTQYEHYLDEMVELDARSTLLFMNVLKDNGYQPENLKPNLVHILSSAYLSAIFEIVNHNMDKAEADEYAEHITAFFAAGWNALLKFQE
ncbi:MAG: TetR/AcrR family transcriptional regulator [Lachnospiraceae bacterium]